MIITADGSYKLDNGVKGINGAKSVVYVSGAVGTATMQVVYYNDSGTAIDMANGVIVSPSETIIEHGEGKGIYLVVATSDGSTAINVDTRGIS